MATTETTTPAPDLTCEFKGRTMRLRIPKPEQLAMFQRTLRMIEGMQRQKDLSPERVMKYFEKATQIILSVLADTDDKEWLENEFLEGDLELTEAFGIMQSAIDAMNATKAPTNGPVKKKTTARRTKK